MKRIASLEYGQWDELEELVTNWALIANQALVHVLFQRYGLQSHLLAIKQYLLFGQGEFVRHLIDLLADNVQAGTSSLLHHNLTGIVETAVRASYSQVSCVCVCVYVCVCVCVSSLVLVTRRSPCSCVVCSWFLCFLYLFLFVFFRFHLVFSSCFFVYFLFASFSCSSVVFRCVVTTSVVL